MFFSKELNGTVSVVFNGIMSVLNAIQNTLEINLHSEYQQQDNISVCQSDNE